MQGVDLRPPRRTGGKTGLLSQGQNAGAIRKRMLHFGRAAENR